MPVVAKLDIQKRSNVQVKNKMQDGACMIGDKIYSSLTVVTEPINIRQIKSLVP